MGYVFDVEGKMLRKIEERSVADPQHYHDEDQQFDVIINIAVDVFSEYLDEVENGRLQNSSDDNTFTDCLNEIVEITGKIFDNEFQIFRVRDDIRRLIRKRFIEKNKGVIE
jgi:hypothetical protein